jgi:hypothetical protein
VQISRPLVKYLCVDQCGPTPTGCGAHSSQDRAFLSVLTNSLGEQLQTLVGARCPRSRWRQSMGTLGWQWGHRTVHRMSGHMLTTTLSSRNGSLRMGMW